MNEQQKYEVIKKLVETNGNKNRAAVTLGCTRRTIDRLIHAYKTQGKAAFSHGNKGRSPVSLIPQTVRRDIVFLYENKYADANIRHFTELLARYEQITLSESTVRNILLSADILSPKAHKATIRSLEGRLSARCAKTASTKEKTRLQDNIFSLKDSHPRRPRCQYAGEMIQMDASLHLWFGSDKVTLHAAIDDATGAIVGAFFDRQETLYGYYQVFAQILSNYGIPYMLYTDRRSVFTYNQKKNPALEQDSFTQFGYACKQLGVDLKTTSIPQAKGRVERLFETLQSRLPVELRLAGVNTIEQANEFLSHYIREFNAKFALHLNCSRSVFETQPSAEKIDQYLAILTPRKVDAGHCIRFQNNFYTLLDDQGMRTDFHKGTAVMVIKTLSGKLYASVQEELYSLQKVETHERVSRYFASEAEQKQKTQKKKPYIPDMQHPWKRDNFMRYVHAMVGKEEQWAG